MSRFLSAFLLFAFAVAATAFSGLEARATTDYDAIGYPGTYQRPAVCKDGSYLVGFKGRKGSWIDQIIPYCAPVLEGGLTGKTKSLGSHGGSGGKGASSFCEENAVIPYIEILIDPGARTLNGIKFSCFDINSQTIHERRFKGPNKSGIQSYDQACPPGEAATGVNINYGAHVNGLGLICEELVIPAAAEPEPDPVEIRGFAGVWDTNANGEFFTLILETNGADVTGYFGHSNPNNDGTLRGTLGSRRDVTFTFQQKNGAAGSGAFDLSEDGNSFTGRAGANGQTFDWSGTRRP